MTAPAETRRGRSIVWLVIAAGIAVMVLGVAFAGRFGSDPTITSSPLIGKPAPSSPIADFDGGGDFRLSDYAGDIVVVNFWASWCLGCRTEHAALTAAAEAYEDFDVTFVGVNYQDGKAQAEDFLGELGRSPVTRYGIDATSSSAFEFGVLGLPETFFIDRDGIVVAKVSGPVTRDLLNRTIDAILLGHTVGDIRTGDVENR